MGAGAASENGLGLLPPSPIPPSYLHFGQRPGDYRLGAYTS